MATRSVRTVTASGGSASGGGYTHPACICNTIHCSPCYKENFTSTIDGTECSLPNSNWVTLVSQCGADMSAPTGYVADFDYDYYNYREVKVEIALGSCATTGSAGVFLKFGGTMACGCQIYHFPNLASGTDTFCCYNQLACTNCFCKGMIFRATFYPSYRCSDQSFITSGCQLSLGGHFNGWTGALGSYMGLVTHQSGPFHVCSYAPQYGVYCYFYCNFDGIRICNFNQPWTSNERIQKVHIMGLPYKTYTP